jgi:hypothetical protein
VDADLLLDFVAKTGKRTCIFVFLSFLPEVLWLLGRVVEMLRKIFPQ